MCGKRKKTMFLLATGYILWWLVASLYVKKTGSTLRKNIETAKENWEGSFKVLANNFVETHSNLLDNLKEEIMTEENKAIFNEHKEEIFKILDSYKSKWTVLLKELKTKWESYKAEATKKLKDLYEDWIESINEMKDIAPKKAQELKKKLKWVFEEIEEEIEDFLDK